ncbi:MAG: type II and III secretion system protein family protein, partial [Gammaproteobacteria bacterium]|nr:type II and III secretion system protein family protein [Gammaproteobacteria bacterium]
QAENHARSLVGDGRLENIDVVQSKALTLAADDDVGQVLIGNPDVADVVALTNRKIYVLGRKIGVTSVTLLDREKNVIAVLNVNVTYDVELLRQRIKDSIRDSEIKVASVNGGIFLSGTVSSATSLQRALDIAEQVAPKAITNAISVRGTQQVLLEVRFIEASRNSSRELGIGVAGKGGGVSALTGAAVTAAGGGPLFALASGNTPFGVAIAKIIGGGTPVSAIIQALEQRGLARVLAEPNLVAQSGQPAEFLAGGEFPFPVQSDKDTLSVEFKKFGVGLSFTPTVLGEGLINLVIEPEVSQLDPTASVSVGGVRIPGLSVRRARTTIELRDGQSFAMAGLLQAENYKNREQIPWIGQVPILGALLSSSAFRKKETELVIIVTPRLVRPKRPGPDGVLKTSFDNRISSSDKEFFIDGKMEIPVNRTAADEGHILELPVNESVVLPSYKGFNTRIKHAAK